jgi:hypothetical protein
MRLCKYDHCRNAGMIRRMTKISYLVLMKATVSVCNMSVYLEDGPELDRRARQRESGPGHAFHRLRLLSLFLFGGAPLDLLSERTYIRMAGTRKGRTLSSSSRGLITHTFSHRTLDEPPLSPSYIIPPYPLCFTAVTSVTNNTSQLGFIYLHTRNYFTPVIAYTYTPQNDIGS